MDKPKKKKSKPKSPTARSLEELRERGWTAQVVERWNPHAMKRIDLFGCIDVIACRQGEGTIGVQATSGEGGNHAARRAKAMAEPKLLIWLLCNNRFFIWSWRKAGKAGSRKLWDIREDEITLLELQIAQRAPLLNSLIKNQQPGLFDQQPKDTAK